MIELQPEDRVSILLKLLGQDLTNTILEELTPDRTRVLQQKLNELDPDALDDSEIDQVLDDLQRTLEIALQLAPSTTAPKRASAASSHRLRIAEMEEDEEDAAEDPFVPSGHVKRDLQRIAPERLAAVLEHEHPAMAALVLQAMAMEPAGAILELFSESHRQQVFRAMQSSSNARRELLDAILKTAIERAALVDLKELQAQKAGAERKLAELLRAMNRKNRFGLLNKIAEEDPETANRIRDQLYAVEDILRLEPRSVQKLLGRIDTATLAVVLKDTTEPLREKIFNNLSKRAASALREEMEFSMNIQDDAKQEARLRIVRVIMEMDEKGEADFEGN